MENERVKTLRGDILQFMFGIYDSRAAESSVITAYYAYYHPDQIRKALAYLTDSKYLECEATRHPFKALEKVKYYKLTPKGINVIEGSLADPGIFVVEN